MEKIEKIVKGENDIFWDKNTTYRIYVITSNNIDFSDPVIAKRMYYAPVNVIQENIEAVKKKKM